MMTEQKKSFSYSYSGKQQEEVRQIREKYIKRDTSSIKSNAKMEELRMLDKKVELTATIVAVCIGILGLLILGIGLSMVLTGGNAFMVPGTIVGMAGFLVLGCAYPVHKKTLKTLREKYAPEIMQLSEELMK